MKISNQALIEELNQKTLTVLEEAQRFLKYDNVTLNWKEQPNEWSILECIEHLNRYGDFYLPEISSQLQHAQKATPQTIFKSSWLGNYFAEILKPTANNKMKTLKPMNPVGSQLDKTTLTKFINQQHQMLQLLQQAQNCNLSTTKTGISVTKLIKLRMGDTFRVVIYHNERHIAQALAVKSRVAIEV
jgi:hypothetical protein